MLAQVSEPVNKQRREIGELQHNEKRLSQLIDRLSSFSLPEPPRRPRRRRGGPGPHGAGRTATPGAEGGRTRRPPSGNRKPPRTGGDQRRFRPSQGQPAPAGAGALAGARRPAKAAASGKASSSRPVRQRGQGGGRRPRGLSPNGCGLRQLLIVDHGDSYPPSTVTTIRC